MRRSTALAALVLAGVLAAGCGDDAGQFDQKVAEVRSAVERGDRENAETALDDLALEALAAGERGEITDDELQEVAELIESSRALLDDVIIASTTTTTMASTTAPPTTSTTEPGRTDRPKEDPKDKDKGKSRGAGNDEGDDDEGDDD